jgi:hypothetical protein
MIDWLTFSSSDLAGQYELLRALFEYLPQLLVGQSLEERHLAQFFKGRHGELSLAGIIGKPTCMRVSPGSEQTRRAPQSFSTIPRGHTYPSALRRGTLPVVRWTSPVTLYISCVELLVRMMPFTAARRHPRCLRVI